MNKYSEEQLSEVERYAGLCFTPREVGLILGVGQEAFSEDCQTIPEVKRAYRRGMLLTEAQVRKATIDLAKGGSSAAYSDYRLLARKRDLELVKNA
jgi:hypothetical protein